MEMFSKLDYKNVIDKIDKSSFLLIKYNIFIKIDDVRILDILIKYRIHSYSKIITKNKAKELIISNLNNFNTSYIVSLEENLLLPKMVDKCNLDLNILKRILENSRKAVDRTRISLTGLYLSSNDNLKLLNSDFIKLRNIIDKLIIEL